MVARKQEVYSFPLALSAPAQRAQPLCAKKEAPPLFTGCCREYITFIAVGEKNAVV